MVEPTKVLLSEEDRELIRKRRLDRELSQAQAGQQAWPDKSTDLSKVRWSQIELGSRGAVSVDTLEPALNVIGLELSALKLRKAKA